MKVLVVEDDPALAEIIRRNLRAHGHTTSVATSAASALRLVRAEIPNVLVLDVNLPDGSGWDVLRGLDAAGLARPRVVVISAAPVSQKRIEEFAPARVLHKPFPMTTLLHALEDEGTASASDAAAEGIDIA